MKNIVRCVIGVQLAVICMNASCGPPPPAVVSYPVLEFTDAETGEPLVGAKVLGWRLFPGPSGYSQLIWPLTLAPTDGDGHTVAPVMTGWTRHDRLEMRFDVTQGEIVDEVIVRNRLGATGQGAFVAARVVEVDGPPPALPSVEILEGVDPATVRIDGYVTDITACSVDDGTLIWRVASVMPSYVSEVILGEIQEGFYSDVGSFPEGLPTGAGAVSTWPWPCPFEDWPEGDWPEGAFAVQVTNRRTYEPAEPIVFCLEDGAAVSCTEELPEG